MIITQERLIQELAEKEDLPPALVRRMTSTLEELIFHYLSMASPTETVTLKPFSGLSIECKYIPERQMHTYTDIRCRERIWAKPKITRYYNRKLNAR